MLSSNAFPPKHIMPVPSITTNGHSCEQDTLGESFKQITFTGPLCNPP